MQMETIFLRDLSWKEISISFPNMNGKDNAAGKSTNYISDNHHQIKILDNIKLETAQSCLKLVSILDS